MARDSQQGTFLVFKPQSRTHWWRVAPIDQERRFSPSSAFCISPLFISIYKIVAYFLVNDVSRFQRTIHQVSRVIFIVEDTFFVNEHAVCLLWSFWHVIASGRIDILKVYLPASAGTTIVLSHIWGQIAEIIRGDVSSFTWCGWLFERGCWTAPTPLLIVSAQKYAVLAHRCELLRIIELYHICDFKSDSEIRSSY